jgi:hypothetical protein
MVKSTRPFDPEYYLSIAEASHDCGIDQSGTTTRIYNQIATKLVKHLRRFDPLSPTIIDHLIEALNHPKRQLYTLVSIESMGLQKVVDDPQYAVTPTMIDAGLAALRDHSFGGDLSDLVKDVFVAMRLEELNESLCFIENAAKESHSGVGK